MEEIMAKLLRRWAADESAATAIEYAFIASLIAVAIVTAVTTIGTNLNASLQRTAAAFG